MHYRGSSLLIDNALYILFTFIFQKHHQERASIIFCYKEFRLLDETPQEKVRTRDRLSILPWTFYMRNVKQDCKNTHLYNSLWTESTVDILKLQYNNYLNSAIRIIMIILLSR